MFKEWAERKLDEMVLRSVQFGKNRGLKKEGKPYFDKLIGDYKRGEQILFSRYIHILDGFDFESNISGLNNLGEAKNRPLLIVANHSNAGPLRGHGQRIVINHYVNEITQKEVRWLHGLDKTTLEQFTRQRFAKQSNTIPVRDDDPKTSFQLIRQALRDKDAIGINPEGDGNKTLLRAVPTSARMIILAAINNYNITCVATDFRNDTFFMAVDSPLDNKRLREARKISKPNEDKFHQLLADYAMARIAQYLPEEKRGYYSNPQGHIDAFECLITPK